MSDQISEKMARKLYLSGVGDNEWSRESEDRFIENLKCAGFIKPSKLDEARYWVKYGGHFGTNQDGISECAEKYEAAITEILEERE